MAVASAERQRRRAPTPSLAQVRELARDHNLIPLHADVHRRLPDAGLGVPEAARPDAARRSCSSPPTRAGSAATRSSAFGHARCCAGRWAIPAIPTRSPPTSCAASARRRCRTCRRSRAARSGMFAYDLVRTVEPLGEPNPDPVGRARPGADAHRRAGRVRPPQAHDHGDRQRLRRRRPGRLLPPRAWRRSPRCAWRLARPGAAPIHGRTAPRRAARLSPTCRASSSRRWSRGSSSTSTPATPSRSCPRSAGRRRCRSRRSRSTAGCAPSTRARTCTSWTSATSRSPAPAPSRCITVTGRRVSTRPIAGTRPRGATAEEDRRIAEELLADQKERAEHVMLVDLGRNDLGRVCEYGTVEVESFMAVENYSHVMHIVSSVAGTLRAGVGALDALRSVLPAGHAVGRAEGPRDADHRRARAGQARRLRRRDRLRSATPATSTPASTSARSWSRTASPTCRPAAARSPTPSPTTSSAESEAKARAVLAGDRAGRGAAGVALVPLADAGPRRRQLRQLHLQPRPVPRRARRRDRGRPQRPRDRRRAARPRL